MLSCEDDDFVLDKAIYKKDPADSKTVDIQYFQYVNSSMRALSMKWPYLAF